MQKTLLIILAVCASSLSYAQKNYNVQKIHTPPIVDGVADELYSYLWTSKVQDITNCIRESLQCEIATPATNCTNMVQWVSAMDEDFLYVFVSVQDNQINKEDGVSLYFAMDNDRTSNCPNNWPRAYNANTFEIVAINPADPKVSSPNGMGAAVEAAKVQLTNCGYNIEFKLSFSEMDFLTGLKPINGRKIGFDISNYNQDGLEKSQLMWNNCCSNRNWTESTNFGTLTFDEGKIYRRSADSPANHLGDINICTGSEKITSLVSHLSIYPNPAANEVQVNIKALQNEQISVEIVNALSQKVYSSSIAITAGENSHLIPTSQLQNGVYTVFIQKDNRSTSKILVINK